MTNSNNDRRILTQIRRCKAIIAYQKNIQQYATSEEIRASDERIIQGAERELEHYQDKLRYKLLERRR